jgi:hypothetical protein
MGCSRIMRRWWCGLVLEFLSFFGVGPSRQARLATEQVPLWWANVHGRTSEISFASVVRDSMAERRTLGLP